jgi:hypothetical protein
MARVFTLFHLSLQAIRQTALFAVDLDREHWLRRALSETFSFPHWGGGELTWVPRDAPLGLIFGIIQQEKDHILHEPPEAGGAEISSREWQGAYVVIDPRPHEEGQRAAVENDVVGKPSALLKSLLRAINE